MKNYWLTEIQINKIVSIISEELNVFVGTKTDMEDWAEAVLECLRSMPVPVRDAVMSRYNFFPTHDDQGHVQKLEFAKHSWLI